ncbi:MAG TPA: nucleoside triphosphate pyrophosphatase [Sphingomonadaceae bacterium]|nr:nucleoside triphosphate pyrophosphatase [Sphingomonadaceae bacterium]
MNLVLASASASRRAMLTAAGIAHEVVAPGVDETAVKLALAAEGHGARQLADALAELKALKISRRFPTALVLGCDSIVTCADGSRLDKAESREEAREQLRALRGTTHRLTSAAVLCQQGAPVWRHIDVAKLTMRDVSDAFLDTYLDREWPAIAGCVGCYRIEGLGIQLFSRLEGSHFTILGLPLLPLLEQLRLNGTIAA